MSGLLARIAQKDETNLRANQVALGDLYDLSSTVRRLYTLLLSNLSATSLSGVHKGTAGTMFLLATRNQHEKAILQLMRGHVSECLFHIRTAVEQAGIADVVRRDETYFALWLRAKDDISAYEAYRKAFKTTALFPRQDDLMQRLWVIYDFCSTKIHASVYAFLESLQTAKVAPDGALELEILYYDLRSDQDLMLYFLLNTETHSLVLRVFGRLFQDTGVKMGLAWESLMSELESSIEERKQLLGGG